MRFGWEGTAQVPRGSLHQGPLKPPGAAGGSAACWEAPARVRHSGAQPPLPQAPNSALLHSILSIQSRRPTAPLSNPGLPEGGHMAGPHSGPQCRFEKDPEPQEGKTLAGKTGAPGSWGRSDLGPGCCFASPLPVLARPGGTKAPNVIPATCHPLGPAAAGPQSSSPSPGSKGAGAQTRQGLWGCGPGPPRRSLGGTKLACPVLPLVTSPPKGPRARGLAATELPGSWGPLPAQARGLLTGPGGDTADSPARPISPRTAIPALAPTRVELTDKSAPRPHRTHSQSSPPAPGAV